MTSARAEEAAGVEPAWRVCGQPPVSTRTPCLSVTLPWAGGRGIEPRCSVLETKLIPDHGPVRGDRRDSDPLGMRSQRMGSTLRPRPQCARSESNRARPLIERLHDHRATGTRICLVRVAGTAPAASGSRNRRSSHRAPPCGSRWKAGGFAAEVPSRKGLGTL